MKNQLLTATAAALATFHNADASWVVKETIINKLNAAKARGITIEDPKMRPGSVLNSPVACENGAAVVAGESFDCSGVDFLSFLSYADMEITSKPHTYEAHSADIWGWESPSGKNIVTYAMDNGAVLVDVTEPTNPCLVAKFITNRPDDVWADVKVMNNTLYHVKDYRLYDGEETADVGIEVYDLLQFDAPEFDCHAAGFEIQEIEPDYTTPEFGWCHNVIVNPDSNRLYAVGTIECNGGILAYDASNRLEPVYLGCADSDGYTHDAQCVTYPSDGPDERFVGKEICFAFNEDTLTIWDMTDMENVEMLARTTYSNSAYSHQGWVNKDLTKVLLDDELDELCNEDPSASRRCLVANELNGLIQTSTVVFDITNLTNPVKESVFVHKDIAIDHNLYVWGDMHARGWTGNGAVENGPDSNFAYLHNYVAGLRILNITDVDSNNWFEAAFFDVAPDHTAEIEFLGSWSGFMFSDGTYVVSSIERGLFVLNTSTAFPVASPAETPAPTTGSEGSIGDDLSGLFDSLDTTAVVVLVAIGIVVGCLLAMVLFCVKSACTKDPAAKATAEAKELQVKPSV